jgi:glycosyl-4,4'-diaponeurosporenoate acyltransferase
MSHVLILIAANALGCAALQLTIAAIAVRIDARHFGRDSPLYRTHPAEIAFYRRVLRIRRWKSLLPDGAPWVGGAFRKKRLAARDSAYFRQFLLETRRGEAAHWLMLACFPIFFLFNPPWARAVIAVYALAANLPCILAQRYNRAVAERILDRHLPQL